MGLGTQTINTTLAINGSISMKSRLVKSATALTLSDYAVAANASSGAFTITLPAISSTAGACNGMVLFIKKVDNSVNSVTLTASGKDTIESSSSIVLSKQYDSIQLISNNAVTNSVGGNEWLILQSAKCGALLT
jgi:PBP1b-binding outer membrane lipoprotein LpoB